MIYRLEKRVDEILPEIDLKASVIRDTLNSDGGTVDNHLSSFFLKEANVTMWAKYKPTKYNADFTDKSTYWKASNGRCGLYIPEDKGSEGLDRIKNLPWSWDNPSGGRNEPYRLGDFRGYNKYAKLMLVQGRMKDLIKVFTNPSTNQSYIRTEMWIYNPEDVQGLLLISDCEFLQKLRYGIRINEGNGRVFVKTSSKTIGEVYRDSGILTVEYPVILTDSGITQYTVTQFLTDGNYSSEYGDTINQNMTFFSIPNLEGYKNEGIAKITGKAGITLNCDEISNDLRTGYKYASDFTPQNPFKVPSYGALYFKLKITSDDSNKYFYGDDLNLSAENTIGVMVTVDSHHVENTFELYDEKFNLIPQLRIGNISTDYSKPTIVYLKTNIFNKNTDTGDPNYGNPVETRPSGEFKLSESSIGPIKHWGVGGGGFYIQGI